MLLSNHLCCVCMNCVNCSCSISTIFFPFFHFIHWRRLCIFRDINYFFCYLSIFPSFFACYCRRIFLCCWIPKIHLKTLCPINDLNESFAYMVNRERLNPTLSSCVAMMTAEKNMTQLPLAIINDVKWMKEVFFFLSSFLFRFACCVCAGIISISSSVEVFFLLLNVKFHVNRIPYTRSLIYYTSSTENNISTVGHINPMGEFPQIALIQKQTHQLYGVETHSYSISKRIRK